MRALRAQLMPDCGTFPDIPPAGEPAVPMLSISKAFIGKAHLRMAAVSAMTSGAFAASPPSTMTS